MTYVIEDDGKTNAQPGSHDDIVMAAAIDLFVMETHATPVMDIVSPVMPQEQDAHPFVFVGGQAKHVSEIKDDARRPGKDEDEESSWFRRFGW